ncbi:MULTISPECIES: hypothetical protein [Legionella]|uniref:Coiled coil protein n=1 Tax=Legionella drozanskii LLAP-1 TaxID=1212489 RepID=A0A0W0TBF2_9GAMM|nr:MULTISPECIES: hypothetical protein [Legionella]KTC92898.1 hypothetical protein Ldro_0269 [Legionella drozanskii LLAP-1]PJE12937.1 MAG: hypothetical protein CK430_06850 [Legionella sp.]
MLRALNKISGAAVGFVLYPIKSAIVNAFIIIGTFVLATIIILGLPILSAIQAFRTNEDDRLGYAIASLILTGLLTFFIGVPFAIIVLAAELTLAINDVIRSFIAGTLDGYNEGLFSHVINRFLFDFSYFSTSLTGIVEYVRTLATFVAPHNDPQPMDEAAFAALHDKTGQEVVFSPLSEEELASAQEKEGIKTILDKYIDLDARLTKLDQEIARGQTPYNSDLDEMMMMDIEIPVLVVKMFEVSPDQWRAVPGTTKISCDIQLNRWLGSENNSHPTTREPMDNANPHEDKNTKYVITPYTSKKDSKELVEAADLIRKELAKVEVSLPEAGLGVVKGVSSLVNQMFFGQGVVSPATPTATQGYTP